MLAAALGLSACGGSSSTPETIDSQSAGTTAQEELADDGLNNGSVDGNTSVDPNLVSDDASTTGPDQVTTSDPEEVTIAENDDLTSAEVEEVEEVSMIEPDETTNNVTNEISDPIDLNTPFVSLLSDPVWRVCPTDVGTDSSDSWQVVEPAGPGNGFRDCVKRCPTDDNFIPDPDFPGLGWDNALSTACAVVSDSGIVDSVSGETEFRTVPLYIPDQQPTRQAFTGIGAFQVITGGGAWQCTHQQRNLSSDSFTDTGLEIAYQFSSQRTVSVQRSDGVESPNPLWHFDRRAGTRVIVLPYSGEPDDERGKPRAYVGNIQIDGNSMLIYRTTVDRLACISERPENSVPDFPATLEQTTELPALLLNDVLGRPMNCTAYEALDRCIDCESSSPFGQISALESSPVQQFIDINLSESVDLSGQVRYELQSGSGQSFTVDEDGLFDSFFGRQGASSISSSQVFFRQFNDRIVMTQSARYASSGSSSGSTRLSICDVLQ